jgi:phosphate butyryltransferase
MVLKNFDELKNLVKTGKKKRMVVAVAADDHALGAAFEARKHGIADFIAVGDGPKIKEIAAQMHETIADSDIYDEKDGVAACEKAVSLIREGKGDFLMKGKIDTSVLLKAVVNKEKGLNVGHIISHVAMFEVPNYHKVLTCVDGGMVTYPTLEQKVGILNNTVNALRAIGYEKPKVAVLACTEKVNPKMPETLDGAELQARCERGEIKNCVINGPISYDIALRKDIADLKGYKGEVAGDADILLVGNIHTGNLLGKCFYISCGGKMAGIVVGAACPIVLSSRAASEEEKFDSIMLSAAVAAGGKN